MLRLAVSSRSILRPVSTPRLVPSSLVPFSLSQRRYFATGDEASLAGDLSVVSPGMIPPDSLSSAVPPPRTHAPPTDSGVSMKEDAHLQLGDKRIDLTGKGRSSPENKSAWQVVEETVIKPDKLDKKMPSPKPGPII